METKYRRTTIKYHEDPPYKDEPLLHYVRRSKNVLRVLLYYDITLRDLFDLLQDSYHSYPSLVVFKDSNELDYYLQQLSTESDLLIRNKLNVTDIAMNATQEGVKKLIDSKHSKNQIIKRNIKKKRKNR